MINGVFKVRDKRLVDADESAIADAITETRNRLYKSGKYEEIKKRTERKQRVQKLDMSSRSEDEIKLFAEDSSGSQETEPKEEFRVKSRFPVIKQKQTPGQRSLFEEADQANIIQCDDYKETPELNLLVTDYFDSKQVEEDFVQVKAVDETILKKLGAVEKKPEKTKTTITESKIELPKNVKLRFGDD
jgi:hypothetical protein